MRVGIFYMSHTRGGAMRNIVDIQSHANGELVESVGQVYVRCEEVEADDLGAALDMAAPQNGECVMNTHELPEVK